MLHSSWCLFNARPPPVHHLFSSSSPSSSHPLLPPILPFLLPSFPSSSCSPLPPPILPFLFLSSPSSSRPPFPPLSPPILPFILSSSPSSSSPLLLLFSSYPSRLSLLLSPTSFSSFFVFLKQNLAVAQAVLELKILLPHPPNRCVLPSSAHIQLTIPLLIWSFMVAGETKTLRYKFIRIRVSTSEDCRDTPKNRKPKC